MRATLRANSTFVLSAGQRRSPALPEGRPRCPTPPPAPAASGPLPRGSGDGRGGGDPCLAAAGGTAGAGSCDPPSRGSHRPGTPRRGSPAPPAVPPHPRHPRFPPPPRPRPGIVACTGSRSPSSLPPIWFRGAGARCRAGTGVGGHTHDTPFAAPPPPPPRRDGPRRSPPAPRPRRGRAAAAAKPSQVTKSNLKPGTINEDFCRPWRLVLPGTKINARNRNLIT